jgi:hypothetical protein
MQDPSSDSPKTIQRRLTVDRRTEQLINRLVDAWQGPGEPSRSPGRPAVKAAALAAAVNAVLKNRKRWDDLRRFYLEDWLDKLEPHRCNRSVNIHWDRSADDALFLLGYYSTGRNNGSEAFRVIVTYVCLHVYRIPLT